MRRCSPKQFQGIRISLALIFDRALAAQENIND